METLIVLHFIQYASSNVKMIIVGNKCDLEAQRQVTPEEGQKVCIFLPNFMNILCIDPSKSLFYG